MTSRMRACVRAAKIRLDTSISGVPAGSVADVAEVQTFPERLVVNVAGTRLSVSPLACSPVVKSRGGRR